MNQEELDLFSIIERIISQWKIILIFNLISILILLFFLNPLNQVHETKIKFGINPSFKSDISFQTISALKNYAEIEAKDIEEKYKSFLVNYDSYQNVAKDVLSYTPDETRSTYNNLYLENDRNKNQCHEQRH